MLHVVPNNRNTLNAHQNKRLWFALATNTPLIADVGFQNSPCQELNKPIQLYSRFHMKGLMNSCPCLDFGLAFISFLPLRVRLGLRPLHSRFKIVNEVYYNRVVYTSSSDMWRETWQLRSSRRVGCSCESTLC